MTRRSGSWPSCPSILRTWRRSRSRRACGRRTSPVCSGRKWIWRGGWRGFIPTRRRRDKAIPVPLNAEAVALVQQAGREAPDARVQLSGQADHAGQHESLVCGAWSGPASRIFGGTICGTPGRAGTCRTARRCSRCRSWAAGRVAEMVRRYAHLAADHLAPYAERLCAGAGRRGIQRRHKYGTGLKKTRACIAASP